MTRTSLVLVRPLGFSLSDRYLKRSGLDYWNELDLEVVDDFDFSNAYFFSSKATKRYCDVEYSPDATLVFGSETAGLPPALHEKYPDRFLTIPMASGFRSINLATSVGIVLFEALRQNNYPYDRIG